MINPGTLPVEDAREDLAAAALDTFMAEVRARAAEAEQVPIRHRIAGISGDPVRDATLDREGRFGWTVPFSDGRQVPVLMPGVEVSRMRGRAATAPCLYVGGQPWWWVDAVGSLAGEGMAMR